MFLYSKQIYESHLSKENMTQPSSMFIGGKIIEMSSVKFFLKHPVYQHEDTNNERLSLAMPHSGLKPKNENDPKEEDDLQWNTTFDGRRLLTEDDL